MRKSTTVRTETIPKRTAVLKELYDLLKDEPQEINLYKFIRQRRISAYFSKALIELGIVEQYDDNDREMLRWSSNVEPSLQLINRIYEKENFFYSNTKAYKKRYGENGREVEPVTEIKPEEYAALYRKQLVTISKLKERIKDLEAENKRLAKKKKRKFCLRLRNPFYVKK